jgi:pimeloyl-ACP methyl ester carboxylesterase
MRKEVFIHGKKLVYHVHGTGVPVVLVHGFAETSQVWVNQVESLAGQFELIIPDLPGSGESELIADLSMEGFAEAIKLVLDDHFRAPARANTALVTLIGHSMGGYITLAFAEKHPGYLKSFGLFQSTAYADSREKTTTRRKGIEFIHKHGAFPFLETAIPKLFSPITREARPAMVSEYLSSLSNFSSKSLVLYYEAMIRRPDRSHVLKTKDLPVLFVMGKYDTGVAPNDSLALCQLPDLSYIHTLAQSGHMGMLEEVKKTNRLLAQFISET